MPAVKITNKPIGIPGDDTHFIVTQPELPEGYTPTGQETEEELAELKVESVREIEMDDMVELIQDKLDMDVTPTTGSSKPVTSGGIKAALDLMDDDISSLNEDITNLETNKQDALTFDQTPTDESTNPVTSVGIKNAIEAAVDVTAPGIYETASGSIASFSDGADDLPMKSAVVTMEPIQEGSGDPSPENVRPISGRTELTVSHSGSDMSDPTTVSVNWETEAGTVYGGTLDVVSGKLVVDRVKNTLDGTHTVSNVVGKDGFTNCRISGFTPVAKNYATPATSPNAVCSDAKVISVYYAWQNQDISSANSFTVNGSNIGMSIPGSFADANAIKAYLTTHNVDVCYEIATPTEIQLTPQEIRTLLGVNNIWSDGGDISVEYPADTKMYIDQKITEAIAAALA